MPDDAEEFRPSRRIVFNGLAALGVAAALAGCGSNTGGAGNDSGASATLPKAGTKLASTSEIPVNGGLILPDQKVVITQPAAGQFKAFTAVCTHQGFLVTSVDGSRITCSHHGSEYSSTTGAVEQGPAPAALSAIMVTVRGGSVLAA
ncbi:MAG: Rieske (2Fe-2S) protein [Marmoricola sp.]